MLCQLSYAPPRFALRLYWRPRGHDTAGDGERARRAALLGWPTGDAVAVRGPSQRHALGVLFTVLALGFAGVAVAGATAGVWVVAVAALALAAWLGSLARQSLKRRQGAG